MDLEDAEARTFLSALVNVRRSKMTQIEIAEKMGVAQSTVSQFENGTDPRMSTVRRYARVLGVQIAHVIEEPETLSDDGLTEVERAYFLKSFNEGPGRRDHQ